MGAAKFSFVIRVLRANLSGHCRMANLLAAAERGQGHFGIQRLVRRVCDPVAVVRFAGFGNRHSPGPKKGKAACKQRRLTRRASSLALVAGSANSGARLIPDVEEIRKSAWRRPEVRVKLQAVVRRVTAFARTVRQSYSGSGHRFVWWPRRFQNSLIGAVPGAKVAGEAHQC